MTDVSTKEIFSKLPVLKETDKVLLLTHTDLDGVGPAILLHVFLDPNNIEVRHCSNGTMSKDITNAVLNEASNFDIIIATDISVSEADAQTIDQSPNNTKLALIDHHKTAIALNQYSWAVVCPTLVTDSFRAQYYAGVSPEAPHSSSGTSLFCDYLNYVGFQTSDDQELEWFIHKIATYDTWDWKLTFTDAEECHELNKIFVAYGMEMFEDTYIKYFTDTGNFSTEFLTEMNTLLLKIEDSKRKNFVENVEKYIKTGNLAINGTTYTICYWMGSKYPDEVVELMKTKYPDKDLYIINYGTGVSIRAQKPEIDASEIAKQLGGGGHKGAAGIKIPEDKQIAYTESALNGKITFDNKVPFSVISFTNNIN